MWNCYYFFLLLLCYTQNLRTLSYPYFEYQNDGKNLLSWLFIVHNLAFFFPYRIYDHAIFLIDLWHLILVCPSGWLTFDICFLFVPQVQWPLTSVFCLSLSLIDLWHLFFCLPLSLIDLWHLFFVCPSLWLTFDICFLFVPHFDWPLTSVFCLPLRLIDLWHLFFVCPSDILTFNICFLFVPQIYWPLTSEFLFVPQVDWPLTSVFCLSLTLIDLWHLFFVCPSG